VPVGEYLGYAAALIEDLGLSSFIIALAVVSVALTLLGRLWGRD